MSALGAHFFSLVQRAGFYAALHREAVALLPPGQGQTWFDVGCGPGLVARLAQEHGYAATGFDIDPHMVAQARKQAAGVDGSRYALHGLDGLRARHGQADVVSAASLLSVLPDRRAALHQLLDLVAPGGQLLLIETSALMAAGPAALRGRPPVSGPGAWVLWLWARVRAGRPAVDVAGLCPPGLHAEPRALLGGLVQAWLISSAAPVQTRGR